MHLQIPLEQLPGIGPKTKELFSKGGIQSVLDLLHYLPKAYVDLRKATSLEQLRVGEPALIRATFVNKTTHEQRGKKRIEVLVREDLRHATLVFFHEGYSHLLSRLSPGSTITVIGTTSSFANRVQMIHPNIYEGDKVADLTGVWPLYPELQSLTSKEIRRHMTRALDCAASEKTVDFLSQEICHKLNIASPYDSFLQIHSPSRIIADMELDQLTNQLSKGHRRLAFNELLEFQIATQKSRTLVRTKSSRPAAQKDPARLFKKCLPFKATAAQLRTLKDIFEDLSAPVPMQRLLQGDVGAGKTAVAIISAIHMAKAGLQTAIMAPTEILAQQHAETFRSACEPLNIQTALLTGSIKKKERNAILADLSSGKISIIIGTHALISDDVKFKNLSYCIIDEQHRFGVLQRSNLKEKGQYNNSAPHLLAMTATPIPRSLAYTLYGDLDLSVLDELPPGRTPVKTTVHQGSLSAALQILKTSIENKEKSYVIFPLIEESEKIDLANAIKGHDELAKAFGHDLVGLLHGRMDSATKNETMHEFSKGQKLILVATSVIEVGVDVKDARHILILNAERFGLSQLHQLRGRVGRGEKESFCYLLTEQAGQEATSLTRLKVLSATNDGFKIANEDLRIRGPGEFLGTRQSGFKMFRNCDLTKHADLIAPAREIAKEMIENAQTEAFPASAHALA